MNLAGVVLRGRSGGSRRIRFYEDPEVITLVKRSEDRYLLWGQAETTDPGVSSGAPGARRARLRQPSPRPGPAGAGVSSSASRALTGLGDSGNMK